MTNKTLFFVQPYVVKRHKLVASGALTFVDPSEALDAGAALARRRAGVVVLAQSYDPARQHLGRPTVLRSHGTIPRNGWATVGRRDFEDSVSDALPVGAFTLGK